MKHLYTFNSMEEFASTNLESPWIALIDKIYYSSKESGVALQPDNEIWYTASEKLYETTLIGSSGIHPNKFGVPMLSHEFNDSKGVVTFDGKVTSIGDYAFQKCSGLTSITIPNSVTSIGEGAFYKCSGLTSITIPNSVTSIGEEAFCECSGLTSITIPNSVTSIGENAFYGCSGLTAVTIPNSVTLIDSSAFYNCSSLTDIIIPDSVINLGPTAFLYCTSLTSITIPNSVKSIGIGALALKQNSVIMYDGINPNLHCNVDSSGATIYNTAGGYNPTLYFKNCEDVTSLPSDIIPSGTNSKNSMQFTIYTDNTYIKNFALSKANSYTIVNVYHLDGSSWN